ncbi:response regulator [Patescibacteria group bacterium]|nr:response regulator [Patescibacteria group bacterium]MCH8048510.1 response regulator [Patescibacteria group bacterium]
MKQSSKQTILLIEDDPLLIDIYSTKFKESGFEVQVADSGEKALSLFLKVSPSLIVMDIVLPHTDGWELLAVAQKQENLKNTKIIVLSNLGQKEEIEKGISLGADRYLIKAHFTPSQVVDEVRELLQEGKIDNESNGEYAK